MRIKFLRAPQTVFPRSTARLATWQLINQRGYGDDYGPYIDISHIPFPFANLADLAEIDPVYLAPGPGPAAPAAPPIVHPRTPSPIPSDAELPDAPYIPTFTHQPS